MRQKISNCKKVEKINTINTERNKILHQIQNKVKKYKEQLFENNLETILDKNELQKVKFLLKDTKLQIKMSDIEPTNFTTNIGSPQRYGLSGV